MDLLQRARQLLAEHYQDRLAGVIVYGSEARGEALPDSDIDLLVLLRPPFERLAELQAIVDLLYPLQLESDRLLSARPASADDFDAERVQLYRNAKQDGVML